jgi:hypothetical protein
LRLQISNYSTGKIISCFRTSKREVSDAGAPLFRTSAENEAGLAPDLTRMLEEQRRKKFALSLASHI